MAPPEKPRDPRQDEIDDLVARVLAARDRLRLMPFAGAGSSGEVDPATGERWDRLNVLGHMAEFIPLWTRQLRMALLTGARIGRDEDLYAARRDAIDGGRQAGERALRARVDAGLGPLIRFLENLRPGELDSPVVHLERGPTTLREAIERYAVHHVEAHVDQLAEVTPPA